MLGHHLSVSIDHGSANEGSEVNGQPTRASERSVAQVFYVLVLPAS